jgi:hypothetical protein
VNRVPVFKNGKLAGAFGEILFGDISEVSYLLSAPPRWSSRCRAKPFGAG